MVFGGFVIVIVFLLECCYLREWWWIISIEEKEVGFGIYFVGDKLGFF